MWGGGGGVSVMMTMAARLRALRREMEREERREKREEDRPQEEIPAVVKIVMFVKVAAM